MALLSPSPLFAEDGVVYKRGTFYEGKELRASVGFREMIDGRLRELLKNGFVHTLVMRVYLYRQSGGDPIAFELRTLKAVYDLWEGTYTLEVQERSGTRKVRLRDQRQVVDQLTSLHRFPIARIERIAPSTEYYLAVLAEFNPTSEELLAEVRKWLRRPSGGQTSESFFGSFVSIFVNNKIRRAEKMFSVRTQPFYRR